MSRGWSALGILAVLALSIGFASLNGAERVTLRLGVKTLYGVPLTVVAFGGLVSGMMIMLVAGVQSDLKVRRILRDRLAEEDREERGRIADDDQRELFEYREFENREFERREEFENREEFEDRELERREEFEDREFENREGFGKREGFEGGVAED